MGSEPNTRGGVAAAPDHQASISALLANAIFCLSSWLPFLEMTNHPKPIFGHTTSWGCLTDSEMRLYRFNSIRLKHWGLIKDTDRHLEQKMVQIRCVSKRLWTPKLKFVFWPETFARYRICYLYVYICTCCRQFSKSGPRQCVECRVFRHFIHFNVSIVIFI